MIAKKYTQQESTIKINSINLFLSIQRLTYNEPSSHTEHYLRTLSEWSLARALSLYGPACVCAALSVCSLLYRLHIYAVRGLYGSTSLFLSRCAPLTNGFRRLSVSHSHTIFLSFVLWELTRIIISNPNIIGYLAKARCLFACFIWAVAS